MNTRPSIRAQLQGVWSVAWRALLLGPVVVPLGYLVLTLAIASLVLPPLYGGICFYAGDLLLGASVIVIWLLWLRVAPRVLKPIFENWRDDG